MDEGTPDHNALAQAQETIARQAAEIERLQHRLANDRFAQEFQEAFTLAQTTGAIASPLEQSALLDMIVETAAQIISARAAALFLIDHETQELIFEVALGQKAETVKKFRVSLGHGIAGMVAVSGQPMAVADAERDPRQAADLAEQVGYIPKSLLCVPLLLNEQIVGVLELLDKQGAPSFSTTDMQILSHFANLAAVAIEHSQTHQHLAALIGEALDELIGTSGLHRQRLQQGIETFAQSIEENKSYQQARDLARLVQEIIWQGDNEFKACQTILQSFADYLRARPKLGQELGAFQ